MDPVRGVTVKPFNTANASGRMPKGLGDDMKDWREPGHEEDGALRVTCYLLAVLSVGICVALLIIVERL